VAAFGPAVRATAGRVDPSIAALTTALDAARKARSLTTDRHDDVDAMEASTNATKDAPR
jgi:hypothetical protein